MRLTLLYFAALRELAGTDEETVVLEATTIAGVAQAIVARHPAFAGRLGSVRFARNETFVRDEEPVGDGDVIALIPPVAGG